MQYALCHRLWSWHAPRPKGLCHYDTFLAIELFVFAEAELRGYITSAVRAATMMKATTDVLQSITSEDMDQARYSAAQAFMGTDFGKYRDVVMHFHRLLQTRTRLNQETAELRSLHTVKVTAHTARKQWHVTCACGPPSLRTNIVTGISMFPAGWYDSDRADAKLHKFTSVTQAVNFVLSTNSLDVDCRTTGCNGTYLWQAEAIQYFPPLLVLFMPERSAAGYVIPGWEANTLIFGGATYDLVAVSAFNGGHYNARLATRPLGPGAPDWHHYDDMEVGGKPIPVPASSEGGPGALRRTYYPRSLHYVARPESVDASNRVPVDVRICRATLSDTQRQGFHHSHFWDLDSSQQEPILVSSDSSDDDAES